jgi:hypothetical protein
LQQVTKINSGTKINFCLNIIMSSPKSSVQPYQPSLLRLLHGVTATLVMLSWISGYWVYNQFDGRWLKLGLPRIDAIIDIHGTIALTFFLVLPLLVIYSLTLGRRKLVQPSTLSQLGQIGKPAWWVGLQRLTNTLLLLATVLAWISGKQMQESWLPLGQLDHLPYLMHLFAWLLVAVCLGLHLVMNWKVGGVPLLLSIYQWQVRPNDRPQDWWGQIQQIWRKN